MLNNDTVTNNYEAVPNNNENKSNTKEPVQYVPFPFSLLRRSICCNMGYKMEILSRSYSLRLNNNNKLYYEEKSDGWALSIKIGGFPFIPTSLLDMVSPTVKVHAVNVETGRYIQSIQRAPTMPLRTKNFNLKDELSIPEWSETLILDANFKDMLNEDTLLLFEIFDERPSLSTTKKKNSLLNLPVRIAWGFLFPIGQERQIHSGILKEWDFNYRDDKSVDVTIPNKKNNRLSTIDENIDSNIQSTLSNNDTTTNSTIVPKEDTVQYNIHSGKESDVWKRIQLYHCINQDGTLGYIQRKIMGWPSLTLSRRDIQQNGNLRFDKTDDMGYPDGIPNVYLQYRRQKHILIPNGWLNVALGPRRIEYAVGKTSLKKKDVNINIDTSDDKTNNNNIVTPSGIITSKSDIHKLKAMVLKRVRGVHELCVIPDRLLHRLQTGPEGAMVVQFSNSGHVLAVVSKSNIPNVNLVTYSSTNTIPGEIYSLRLFDTDDGSEIWSTTIAHYGVIYSIAWSKDDSYLLTCSSDGTSKVWDMASVIFYKYSQIFGGFLGHPVSNNNTNDILILAKIPHNHRYPYCMYSLVTSPLVHLYCGLFQEYVSTKPLTTTALSELYSYYYQSTGERLVVPRIITGSSDGKLRVWDSGNFAGFIYISNKDKITPHQARIQAIVVDERSRYLISGDAVGEIYIWRTDNRGWYELLRKFRKDSNTTISSAISSKQINILELSKSSASGIMSLTMHPDKSKSQLLVMQHNPSSLKVYNMTNYKQYSHCVSCNPSVNNQNVFQRVGFSADGRYVVSCNALSVKGIDHPLYYLVIHDVITGNVIPNKLSDQHFSYPIRSITWHPKQHLMAISMIGEGAAVVAYCGLKEDADLIALKKNSDIIASFGKTLDDKETTNPINQSINLSDNQTVYNSLEMTGITSSNNQTMQLLKTEKTKQIIEKIRSARSSLDSKK